mmetsp:Transcript_35880/g.80894  ORF Transcript_35880/g.80894 Transcript_35880/m.80894 type:complete len:218 (-) Transcript_35880:1363-2016(-)
MRCPPKKDTAQAPEAEPEPAAAEPSPTAPSANSANSRCCACGEHHKDSVHCLLPQLLRGTETHRNRSTAHGLASKAATSLRRTHRRYKTRRHRSWLALVHTKRSRKQRALRSSCGGGVRQHAESVGIKVQASADIRIHRWLAQSYSMEDNRKQGHLAAHRPLLRAGTLAVQDRHSLGKNKHCLAPLDTSTCASLSKASAKVWSEFQIHISFRKLCRN